MNQTALPLRTPNESNLRRFGIKQVKAVYDFRPTAKRMLLTVWRYVKSTPQRRWTTGGIVTAFLACVVFVPSFGIATGGFAFAAWWLAAGVMTLIGGLVGNKVGLHAELKAKQPPADL